MTTPATDNDVKTAAREWLLRLSLESPTPGDRVEFAAWCAADARHLPAYRRYETLWQDVAMLKELNYLAPGVDEQTLAGRWMRALGAPWRVWLLGAGMAAVAAVLGLRLLVAPTHYATGTAEVRDVRLPDGSQISLSPETSIDIAMSPDRRRVVLVSGEAFFSVAKNRARPFIVVVGDKEIRVVGTQFDVRRDDASMRVSVVEGTVDVMQAPERDKTRLVGGQYVEANLTGSIHTPEKLVNNEPAAWRHGRLVYVDAPLREVVADANRYSHRRIVISDTHVAGLRVSVTYPIGRIDDMLAALAESLPLQIDRAAAQEIQLKPRADVE